MRRSDDFSSGALVGSGLTVGVNRFGESAQLSRSIIYAFLGTNPRLRISRRSLHW